MEWTDEQKAEIDKLLEAEQVKTAAVQSELDKLKQPEPSEEQKQIAQLKTELLQQKVLSALKELSLDDFADFIHVGNEEELQPQLEKLKSIVETRKLNTSYQPESKRQSNAYDQAAAKGDTVGMIGSKLSKLFGN